MSYNHSQTKLVRDKIPELIQAHDGFTPQTRILDDDAEYEKYLHLKLIEESREVAATSSVEEITEELADLQEVIDVLCELKGIQRRDIHAAQTAKREKRGSFAKRILMLRKTA